MTGTPNPKEPKQRNKALALTFVGTQMCITIFIGVQLGKWLDSKYPNDRNWFTVAGVLLFTAISMYALLKQLQHINASDDD